MFNCIQQLLLLSIDLNLAYLFENCTGKKTTNTIVEQHKIQLGGLKKGTSFDAWIGRHVALLDNGC